jgi:hypothetical protein
MATVALTLEAVDLPPALAYITQFLSFMAEQSLLMLCPCAEWKTLGIAEGILLSEK